jgi:hypothetical protein
MKEKEINDQSVKINLMDKENRGLQDRIKSLHEVLDNKSI